MPAVTAQFTLETQACIECGMIFGVPKEWEDKRRKDHRNFYCPNGHPMHYPGQSPEEKLRQELAVQKRRSEQLEADVQREKDRAEANRRAAAAVKGQLTTVRKRIAAGVCPCCGRSFKQLRRHLAVKHPEYVQEHTGQPA